MICDIWLYMNPPISCMLTLIPIHSCSNQFSGGFPTLGRAWISGHASSDLKKKNSMEEQNVNSFGFGFSCICD